MRRWGISFSTSATISTVMVLSAMSTIRSATNWDQKGDSLPVSKTTTLPSGTVVTVSLTNIVNERDNYTSGTRTNYRRTYTISVTNCYEGIVITGGLVRLTGSGLGCPTWPECVPGPFTPVPHQEQGIHKVIEFGKFLTSPEHQLEYELSEGGLTPLRPSAEVDALVAEQPHWKPFIDGIEYGGPEPLFNDYIGFQNVMIEMVQSVVTGAAEPAAALTLAASEIEQYK